MANLRPEKGVEAFVEAVSRAREQLPRLRGLVAGDGPQRAELERLVEERDGVRLLGSRGDVPDLIAACDALCLLSEAEALPISILEAMALGRPVVATDVGGTAEAVAHARDRAGGAARRRGAAGALARLAAQPEWARELGERGRARQRERSRRRGDGRRDTSGRSARWPRRGERRPAALARHDAGLARGDSLFADQLRRAGVRVAPVAVRMGATGRLRRAYPVTDLVEAIAARRALRRGASIATRRARS